MYGDVVGVLGDVCVLVWWRGNVVHVEVEKDW